jgi:hypothetical protein
MGLIDCRGGMVFNATFNNISVISWLSVLLVEKNIDLPQVTDPYMIFWRKIVIFHSKYPKKFRAFLRSAQFS